MQRFRALTVAIVACAAVLGCRGGEQGSALDPALRLTGAGLRENEGRTYVGSPTVTDSARLDSLHVLLRDGSWERMELPSPNYTYAVMLWRDSTAVGILSVGPEYMFVLPLTSSPVPTLRRIAPRERQMLDRWFGI
jgi:hypothetical protein